MSRPKPAKRARRASTSAATNAKFEIDPKFIKALEDLASGRFRTLTASLKNQHVSFDRFYDAVARSEDLEKLYARAKHDSMRIIADEMLEIADEPLIGTKTVKKPRGTETTVGDNVERSRLKVDTRKWLLSKLMPKMYGDRLDATIGGALTLVMTKDESKLL